MTVLLLGYHQLDLISAQRTLAGLKWLKPESVSTDQPPTKQKQEDIESLLETYQAREFSEDELSRARIWLQNGLYGASQGALSYCKEMNLELEDLGTSQAMVDAITIQTHPEPTVPNLEVIQNMAERAYRGMEFLIKNPTPDSIIREQNFKPAPKNDHIRAYLR